MNIKKNIRFFSIASIVIVAISFLTYFTTLNSFFSGYDFAQLYFGKYGKLSDIIRLIIPCSQDIYIRPLSDMAWLLNYCLWGLNPVGYHIVNIMLHSINSILVLFLSFFLLKDKITASGAGLLFALHPIHSGTVSLIVRQVDLMCTLFYLLSLLSFAFCVYLKRYRLFYLISIIAYPLALFSKEMAITLPLVIILYDSFLMRRFSINSFLKRLRYYSTYILFTFFYLFWRLLFTGTVGGDLSLVTGRSVFFDFYPPDFIKKIIYYMPMDFFIPLNRSIFNSNSIQLITAVFVLGIIISIALSGKELLWKSRLILFSFLWIILTLIPTHNLVEKSSVLTGARFVYIPSVGLCMALAFMLLSDKISAFKRYFSIGIFSIFCVFYIFITIRNNSIWIATGEINRGIPRIVNEYYKKYGANIRCYFLIPNISREGVELFSNDLPEVLAPLFAPVSYESIILLAKEHPADDTYRGRDFDFRQVDILQSLGQKEFFFRYNDKRVIFEDLSLEIKSKSLKYFNSFKNLKIEIPDLHLSEVSEPRYMLIYVSQPLKIPVYFVGGIEVSMRIEGEGDEGAPNVFWYRDNSQDYLPAPFRLHIDGQFHTYRIPFTLYNPDWIGDTLITKIEILLPITVRVDIDYIKILPYQW